MENLENTLKRRSSIFEFEIKRSRIDREFPQEDDILVYPLDYLQKLNDESEQWKNQVTETLDKREESVKKIRELKKTVFDGDVLSSQQKDFLEDANDCFQRYLQTSEELRKKLIIRSELNNHKDDRWETLAKSLETKKTIKLQISENIHKPF